LGQGPTVEELAVGSQYFFLHRAPSTRGVRAMRRRRAAHNPEVVVDAAAWGTARIDYLAPSPNGRTLAYRTSSPTTGEAVLRFVNAGNGQEVSPLVEGVTIPHVAWLPNSDGFFYAQDAIGARASAHGPPPRTRVMLRRFAEGARRMSLSSASASRAPRS
jgi:hypothetical protein